MSVGGVWWEGEREGRTGVAIPEGRRYKVQADVGNPNSMDLIYLQQLSGIVTTCLPHIDQGCWTIQNDFMY